MKTTYHSKKAQFLTIVSIFSVMAALIAGMAGCDGNHESYTLTITSTPGGSVVEPGEGMFTYYAGTEVHLVAEADEGYQFLSWGGYPIHVVDRKATATTIVMDRDYSLSANFAVPTLVWDWYDLNAIRDDLYGIYILMNDLNSTTPGYEELAGPTANGGKGWQPIGSTNETQFDVFRGTLDGGGHEISDLFINRPDTSDVGLIVVVWEDGGITNLGVVNATVTGYEWVGGLAGGSIGVVDNSYSAATVNGIDNVGGLVGTNGEEGTVRNSYSIGNVTGYRFVGGLVGTNGGTVSNSYSTGSVTGTSYVGGLAGSNGGTVTNSYSTGVVTGEEGVGGLVAASNDNVTNSFWDIQTSGQDGSAAGTGKTTLQMKNIATFSGAAWNITAVALNETNPMYIWNIVDDVTYPFLSWQAV
jgi:Divergent InlB B-repeat domain/The GLUG motif